MSTSVDQKIDRQTSHGSYIEKWNELFVRPTAEQLIPFLKEVCLSCLLTKFHLRSVCWKLFLGCLSRDRSNWLDDSETRRELYSKLKHKYSVDPRSSTIPENLEANNPLSQHDNSSWRQYFIDSELRSYIKQDVERTFPEMAYFQSANVRSLMIQILFIFAREHETISYKQGMHEILGPLLFVLYSDQEFLNHALETGEFENSNDPTESLKTLVTTVINSDYLEHDAYFMFTAIMVVIQDWYCYPVEKKRPGRCHRSPSLSDPLFLPEVERRKREDARLRFCESNSHLVTKLNFLGCIRLQKLDPHLFAHLEHLDIAPQIYGIRWLRLLFGREFLLSELLCLWDAIFSFGPPFKLVDDIFVAMLYAIRDRILDSDYTQCLHLLMRYPATSNLKGFLALVLHLHQPKVYPLPDHQVYTNTCNVTLSGQVHPNSIVTVPPLSRLNLKQTSSMKNLMTSKSNPPTSNWVDSLFKKSPTMEERPRLPQGSRNVAVRRSSNALQPKVIHSEELELLKEQVSCLQYRLNEVENHSRQTALKMMATFDKVDDRLKEILVFDDEELQKLLQETRHLCETMQTGRLKSVSQKPQSGHSNNEGPVEIAHEAKPAGKEYCSHVPRSLTAENEMIQF